MAADLAALSRHRLVWLDDAGWRRVLEPQAGAPARDEAAHACLQHWADHDLPLVVTRQPPAIASRAGTQSLRLGLAAPARWGRRRLFVEARVAELSRLGTFARAIDIEATLPEATRAPWTALCLRLERIGVDARVYGSHGWQHLTGLAYVNEGSDIDLLLRVDRARRADAVVRLLGSAPFAAPRLDGEIVFADGSAVAWREWQTWSSGRATQLLVKRIGGPMLERAGSWALHA